MSHRIFNFSAGPAAIPQTVLERAQDEMLSWKNEGASVMEVSHRGKAFVEMAERAEQDLRELMGIPTNYRVLFLHGGARGQFSAIPLNLQRPGQSAAYVNSGFWAKTAIDEGRRYIDVNVVAEASKGRMPDESQWQPYQNDKTAYLHYTPNETIEGIEFPFIPNSGSVPLVADMSSNILSKPIDVSRFGLIYAGAQKNIGPSGLVLVIVREDLIQDDASVCPSIWNYAKQVKTDSMYNTPPTFAWYMAGLVFQWLKEQGGVEAMETINQRKSTKLYGLIDSSDFYCNSVPIEWRSRMNVSFSLVQPELNNGHSMEKTFLDASEKEGFRYLKGHRAVGGMRASIYNAVPEQHVDALIEFMKEFERRNG